MSNDEQLKIIVVGPIGSGKTTISNFLADATEIPSEHRPTKGVRILEFEIQSINVGNKFVKAEIELWDCSGDHRFETCWPAVRDKSHGVIFVHNGKSQDYVRELEQLYDYFVNQTGLGPTNCVIFHHDQDNISVEIPKKMSPKLSRISQVSCNTEEGANKLKVDFQSFLGTLISKLQEHTDQEEMSLMRDNILFAA
ncbi:intraflagellar transport protein 22 homolog [Neodiprion virginianus]|uniref:intraflagellar transport protein 22 homolog n=1 Tax=Neodiprion virginianus TaxID=2961670 RepID=UPI001EE6B78D|nr:intraflagellar transport protein 22 homolog [Neodiprion virginianus]